MNSVTPKGDSALQWWHQQRSHQMPKVEKRCEVCGQSFSVWPTRADTAKTCSQKCRGVLIAEMYKARRPTKACVVCGTNFSCPPSHEKRKFCCSLACAHELSRRRVVATGEDHFNWKRGSTVSGDGYLYLFVDGHPFATQGGYVLEHRLVVEEWMRAKDPDHHFLVAVDGVLFLRPDIDVHHRNEDKRDNSQDNLLACTKGAHRSIHSGKPPVERDVWPPIVGEASFTPYRVTCTCEHCGTKFQKKRSDVARGAGRFCSRACYDASRLRKTFDAVPL